MMLLMVEFVILYSLAPLARFVPCKVYLDHMRQLAGVVTNISVYYVVLCGSIVLFWVRVSGPRRQRITSNKNVVKKLPYRYVIMWDL